MTMIMLRLSPCSDAIETKGRPLLDADSGSLPTTLNLKHLSNYKTGTGSQSVKNPRRSKVGPAFVGGSLLSRTLAKYRFIADINLYPRPSEL